MRKGVLQQGGHPFAMIKNNLVRFHLIILPLHSILCVHNFLVSVVVERHAIHDESSLLYSNRLPVATE